MDKEEELEHNTIIQLSNYEVVRNDEIMQIKMFNNLPLEIITYVDKDDNVVLLNTTTSMISNSDFVFFDSNKNEIPHSIYTLEAAIPDGKVVLKLAIVIFDSKGILRQLFNEQMDLISYQIKQLREKYHKLKDNDFNEQKHLFKDRYNIDFISDENFFSFLFKRIPSLHFNFNFTYNEKFNIARLNELSFTWLKSDITIGIFHEYCQMIISQFEDSIKIVATKKQTNKDFNVQKKKEPSEKNKIKLIQYVNRFEQEYNRIKDVNKTLYHCVNELGVNNFSKKSLERGIKLKYNNDTLTFSQYVANYLKLSDKLSDKNKL